MAYEKKNLYPSALKPGVYPDGTTKELGLNSDELENISLGNWNSIVKNDRVFLSEYFKQYVVPEVVEPSIQNIPISLLPLITTNGVFNGSMPRNELNHRFFIEIFGYYLNTKTLLDAGFGTGGGGGTDFPTITYGGVTIPFNGTAPGIDVQGHSDQYIYYSYDPTKYLFNPNIANSFPEFSFSPETNPVVVALTIGVIDSSIIEQAEPFNLDTYVELGWYSQDYVDALRASVEFRNFTYEITQDKTNLSNNDIFQRFAIQTTWGEVYRNEYSDGIGSMLNFNRMSSLTPYSYGHQTSDGFNGPEPIGTRVKIQDNFTNSPFGDGNGNTYQIAGGGQFDSFLEQADNKIYTDWNQPKWLDYVGAQITSLNDFLLANIFFLDSNPIEGDETYGSIADQNPLKIYFNDQNEQQLQDILNKELIFYSIPLNDDLTQELLPDGVTADIINTFISGGPSNNFFENKRN